MNINLTRKSSGFLSLSFFTILLLPNAAHTQEAVVRQDVDIPVIDRPVNGMQDSGFRRPYIPVVKSTADGRIGLNFKGAGRIFLNTPEKIQTIFPESPDGAEMLADHGVLSFDRSNYTSGTPRGHVGICETRRNGEGEIQNPYACGNGDDCYDLKFITGQGTSGSMRLVTTEVTVTVSNPKTPNAAISDVEFGEIEVGNTVFNTINILENQVAEDGNLMVARTAGSRLTWFNQRTNSNVTGRYDVVYLPGSDDPAMACDVNQWDTIRPISHAPFDPDMNDRYGFAMKQFRDALGTAIPDGRDITGSYPWMDSTGDNIGFSVSGTDIRDDRLNILCLPEFPGCGDSGLRNHTAQLMNKTILGKWTNGKMILADGLINHQDYAGVTPQDNGQRLVAMYRGNSLNGQGDGMVRVGSGRDTRGNPNVVGDPENVTFLDSVENKFNFWPNMVPVTPRDVVWNFSSGVATDEFAFDDYLYPNGFIISSMVQAITDNGSNRAANFNGITNSGTRVQNGATSTTWNVPASGIVQGSRIERAALGGIHGKGLWMNGDSSIRYAIGSQPNAISDNDWHISLFVDARYDDDGLKRLITFPDGSELQLSGRDEVRYWSGGILQSIELPVAIPNTGWAHIGVQMTNRNRTAEFYYNGFLLDRFTNDDAFFEMSVGDLYVGSNPVRGDVGFRGWIDDFKVIAHHTGDGSWCNHANGSLVGISGNHQFWSDRASGYPAFAHNEITNFLEPFGQPTYDRYACRVNYSGDYASHDANLPDSLSPVGDSYNFPEGPIVHDQPRPESRDNEFCLACHVEDGLPGLDLAALARIDNLDAIDDHRRQPLEARPLVFGNIPANWLANNVPANDLVAPAEGFQIDTLLAGLEPTSATSGSTPESGGFPFTEQFNGNRGAILENWILTDNDIGTSSIDNNDNGRALITTSNNNAHNLTLSSLESINLDGEQVNIRIVVDELNNLTAHGIQATLNTSVSTLVARRGTGLNTNTDDLIKIQVNGVTVDATGINERQLLGGFSLDMSYNDSNGDWSYTLDNENGQLISQGSGTTDARFDGEQYWFLSSQHSGNGRVSYDLVSLSVDGQTSAPTPTPTPTPAPTTPTGTPSVGSNANAGRDGAGANEVCFFENGDFSHNGQTQGANFRTCGTNVDIGLRNFSAQAGHNDSLSAISVGTGVHVIIYTGTNGNGESLCITSNSDRNTLGGSLNNQASSFAIGSGGCPASGTPSVGSNANAGSDGAGANEVCFFENGDFSHNGERQGANFRTCGTNVNVGIRNFNANNDDSLSAISVGTGVHVVIYTGTNGNGESLCITSNSDRNTLGGSLNNQASSFEIGSGSCP